MSNDDDVFELTDGEFSPIESPIKIEENSWIDELRSAVERGCDLGSIRNIGKCRPLTDDLRLAVWKVRLNSTRKSLRTKYFSSLKICLNIDESHYVTEYTDSDVFDLPEQNIIREDVLRLVCKFEIRNENLRNSPFHSI